MAFDDIDGIEYRVDQRHALLSRMGLLGDAESESREAYESIRSRLGNPRAVGAASAASYGFAR